MYKRRIFPGFPNCASIVYPAAPTFVSSTGMSSSGATAAPRAPQTTMQQIYGLLTQPFTRESPLIQTVPQARTPMEAARTLRTIQQAQWGSMIGSIGSEYTMEQRRANQERLMGLERQALEQLRRFGTPVRLRIQ